MLKIVITGPESTGKSTLAKQLASHFNVSWVNEFSRAYLNNLGRTYVQNDLLEIAKGQIEMEDTATQTKDKLLICDTSLEALKIWSEFKYNSCNSFIIKNLYERLPNLYLLMSPDLPWVDDPLRENPDDREALFELYKQELITTKVAFYEITGRGDERLSSAIEVINKRIQLE